MGLLKSIFGVVRKSAIKSAKWTAQKIKDAERGAEA